MGQNEDKKEAASNMGLNKHVLAFALVAGAVTVYLILQGAHEAPSPAASIPPSPSTAGPLVEGGTLPVLPLVSLEGESLEFRPPGGSGPILVFIFSPTCSICHRTLPTWKKLHREAVAESVEVVGLSVLPPATTAEYVRRNDVPWSVYSLGGRSATEKLQLQRVPFTLLLDGQGTVHLALPGELTPDERRTLSEALRTNAS